MESEVLYIENDPVQLEAMLRRLSFQLKRGVVGASSIEEGQKKIDALAGTLKLVVTDMNFGAEDPEGGLRVLDHIRNRRPSYVPVIILTAFGNLDNAVKCMENGAFSYVEKGLEHDGTMRMLIRKANLAIEKKCLHNDLEQKEREHERIRRELSDDLERARKFMVSLEPRTPVDIAGWRIESYSETCDRVGGDFSIVESISGELAVFALGDVVGHGVKAALLAAVVRSIIESAIRNDPNPEKVLSLIFDRMEVFHPPNIVSLVYGTCSSDGWLRYFSAGHPPLFVINEDGVESLRATGPILVALGSELPDIEVSDHLFSPSDRLLVYSDCAFETTDGEGKELGLEKFRGVAKVGRTVPLADALRRLVDSVKAHSGGESLHDDLTLLVAEYLSV